MRRTSVSTVVIIIIVLLCLGSASAQTTAFTYQGSLNTAGSPANGNHDFEFALFDSVAGGTQLGSTLTRSGVVVANGVFAVSLDFGNQFPSSNRFLEIRVRTSGGGGFTVLSPRQPVTSAPYSIKALNADQLGGLSSTQYVVSGAAAINASTQFNINNTRVLSVAGLSNTFVGSNAGNSNSGSSNTFVGSRSGFSNTTGAANSFFGRDAGESNTIGADNAFFGTSAGSNNLTGNENSFFGAFSGLNNSTGSNNSFFGESSGHDNSTGASNSFFGANSGFKNTIGNFNSFFGTASGRSNTEGSSNSFFGFNAGNFNTTGSSNSFFGSSSGSLNETGLQNSFFGHGAGLQNTVGNNNSFFGFRSGATNTSGNSNAFFGDQSGNRNTTGSDNAFFGSFAGERNTIGAGNVFVGSHAGQQNTLGLGNSFFGARAGVNNTVGDRNAFFGDSAGLGNISGDDNSYFGALSSSSDGLTGATAVGYRAFVSQSNSLVLGAINGINGANSDTLVGIGTASPSEKLHIAANGGHIVFGDVGCSAGFAGLGFASSLDACGNYALTGNASDTLINRPTGGRIFLREGNSNQMTVATGGNVGIGTTAPADLLHVNGIVRVATLGAAGATHVCRNASNQLSTCTSFAEGASNEELFKQRAEVEAQKKEIEDLRGQVEALKKLVCATSPAADVCRSKE